MPKLELRDQAVAVEEAEKWLRPLPSHEKICDAANDYSTFLKTRLKRRDSTPTVRMLPLDEVHAIATNKELFLADLVKARESRDSQIENFPVRRQAGFIKEVTGLIREEGDTDAEAKRFIPFLPYWKGMKIATATTDSDKDLYAGITWEVIVPVIRGAFEIEEEARLLSNSGQKNQYERQLRVAQAVLAIVNSGSLPNPIEASEATKFFSQQVRSGEPLFPLIREQIEIEEQATSPVVQSELPFIVNEVAPSGKTRAEVEKEERENYMSRFLLEEINIDNDPEAEAVRVMDEFKRWSEREIEKKTGFARIDARRILSPVNWVMLTNHAKSKYDDANSEVSKEPGEETIGAAYQWSRILFVAQTAYSIIYQRLDE